MEMFNELFTTPCSPVFAGITVGFIGFIKPTQQILKPIGKGTGDNLTVRIDMECRHQIGNTLLYNLSTSVFVDENWFSSGLALSVHNQLSWAHCYERLIRIPGIRGVRLDFLLFDCSLEWGSRGYGRSHSRNEAWIIFIEWWIGIIPPAPTRAKISSCFLFGGLASSKMSSLSSGWLTNSRESLPGRSDASLIDWLLRGRGLRGPHLNRHRSASCFY